MLEPQRDVTATLTADAAALDAAHIPLLSARLLTLARLAAVALSVLCLALLLASLPGRAAALAHPANPAVRAGLAQLGLSPLAHAVYNLALELICALGFFAMAALILWRSPASWMAALVALLLAAFGAGLTGTSYALISDQPIWRVPPGAVQALGWGLLLVFAYLFPDGRFVPRWSRWLLPAWTVWVVAFFRFADAWVTGRPWAFAATFVVWVGWLGTGLAAQVYRYRYAASAAQRLQTKWVVWGFAGALFGGLLATVQHILALTTGRVTPDSLLFEGVAVAVLNLSALLIPVSIAIAILRHNLYDIDQLINRTLVYGTLTLMLAAIYGCSVLVLQALLRGITGQSSTLAIVGATLASAALFQPLRGRLQRGIDRRFYRRRYDAQRTLAQFAAVLRGETDLEALLVRLTAVVEHTMEPAHLSYWLAPAHHDDPLHDDAERIPALDHPPALPEA
ncbi:MAG TPA: hypothetical protein VFU88_05300 [Ktedonobacterales bacterium]|nr:hypothetical protein [Ktedonobacterales bacterium]